MAGMQPFSISVFAKSGDPEGIRHVDKSNWSGCGVVFSRDLVSALKPEPGSNQAGVYILAGNNAAEESIYIGEADPVWDRLKSHAANKNGWVWGVYFFDRHNKIGKTEVQYLEAALVTLAAKCGRAYLMNRNNPTEPTMSPAAKATADAFLADILLILPLLGITAFTPLRPLEFADSAPLASTENERFDTIVVPAREDGFQETFLGENRWYAVRINERNIKKLRYIAAYRVAPIRAITHIAAIRSVALYENTGKYTIEFEGPAQEIPPIARGENSEANMQSVRFALREKLLAAKDLDQIWR